jgi:AcrR family transcriptional regulator
MEEGIQRRSRRAERKAQTRRELVAAAGSVFARRGFAGASVEQIAQEAGYTTGAIYWHFSGKDDLFLAVLEEYATIRVREWEEINAHAAGELPQRARAYADQWMRRTDEDPEFLVLTLEFLVHAWRNPDLREAFSNRSGFGRLAMARLLQAEADAGTVQLPMPADRLGTVLRELGVGLAMAKLSDPDGIRDELFGDFVELFFDLLAEHEARPRARARGNS